MSRERSFVALYRIGTAARHGGKPMRIGVLAVACSYVPKNMPIEGISV